jgi:hypothetical protein
MPQLGDPHGGIIRPSRRASSTPTDVATTTLRETRESVTLHDAVEGEATIEQAKPTTTVRRVKLDSTAPRHSGDRFRQKQQQF